jgi:hypothetical protein
MRRWSGQPDTSEIALAGESRASGWRRRYFLSGILPRSPSWRRDRLRPAACPTREVHFDAAVVDVALNEPRRRGDIGCTTATRSHCCDSRSMRASRARASRACPTSARPWRRIGVIAPVRDELDQKKNSDNEISVMRKILSMQSPEDARRAHLGDEGHAQQSAGIDAYQLAQSTDRDTVAFSFSQRCSR